MLRSRIVTAIALLAGFLSGLYLLPSAGFAILMGLVLLVGAREWCGLTRMPSTMRLAFTTACVSAYAVLAYAYLSSSLPPGVLAGVFLSSVLFWIFAAPIWMWKGRRMQGWTIPFLLGLFMLLPCSLAALKLHVLGPSVLLAALALIWIADTAAYFCGRAFGRRKLAPSISPGKTVEGAAGALLACSIYGLLLLEAAPSAQERPASLAASAAVILSLILCILSILGDLFESMLKRQANLKDSGSILPGHGGVLDRIDSVTSTLPAAALALSFILGVA